VDVHHRFRDNPRDEPDHDVPDQVKHFAVPSVVAFKARTQGKPGP
jgi:hypothetical protein